MKKCSKCGELKEYSEFHSNGKSKSGYHSYCKPCSTLHRRTTTRTHDPVQSAVRRRQKLYGLTNEAFVSLLQAQGYECAICSKVLDVANSKHAVDHNHSTGEVRGVLCWNCNTALGKFQDNPDILRSAVNYLETRGHYG